MPKILQNGAASPFGQAKTMAGRAVGFIVLCLLLPVGCGFGAAKSRQTPESGASAQVPVVAALDAGKVVKQGLGTVTVVNIWATWCPPCVAEMGEFARFFRETNRDKVTLLTFSANGEKALTGVVAPFVAKHQLPFPVYLLDSPDPDILSKVLGATLSGGLPVTLVYDKEGKLVKTWEESITFADLMASVTPLLSL